MIDPWFSREAAQPLVLLSLFATLAGLEHYVKQGRYRALVTAIFSASAGLGAVFLVIAAVAMISGQPGYVMFPFGLSGAIMTSAFALALVKARRQYTEAEMRRITAGDL